MKTLAVAADRLSIASRITALRPDSPRLWGKMSAHQMMCHLNDSFLGPLGERRMSTAPTLLPRVVMKWGALYFPFPWPKGVPTRPEVEQGAGGTPPSDFERDRADLLITLQRFSDSRHSFEGAPHPIFGQMTDAEWLRWGFLHADHHLRQFGL